MTCHPEPPAGSRSTEPADPRRRFRDTIAQIYAHQPSAVLRALAKDRATRSRRP